ncbi:hypothetical protein EQU24_15240 [Methylotuvimicrobium buryatense]|uniref:Uncharacterized protein n=1 Tax=Methylotuvimicrobium buryatense TaxID=95641 RepID=A0A4P9UUT7_METBY|nr:hypothetical protein EQU24_15240 [Methylotuvimicrobium buryatense]
MLGEDVGSRADFCSCKICIHAILGVRAAAKPPWMGLRRSSTGIPRTLKSAKLLKLGIAACIGDSRYLCNRMINFVYFVIFVD